jgi:hypothetical protein
MISSRMKRNVADGKGSRDCFDGKPKAMTYEILNFIVPRLRETRQLISHISFCSDSVHLIVARFLHISPETDSISYSIFTNHNPSSYQRLTTTIPINTSDHSPEARPSVNYRYSRECNFIFALEHELDGVVLLSYHFHVLAYGSGIDGWMRSL